MMSPALVAAVGLIYGYIAAEQFFLGNNPMGVVYLGYAGSNVGIYFMLK